MRPHPGYVIGFLIDFLVKIEFNYLRGFIKLVTNEY